MTHDMRLCIHSCSNGHCLVYGQNMRHMTMEMERSFSTNWIGETSSCLLAKEAAELELYVRHGHGTHP